MIFLDANFIIDLFVNSKDNHEKAFNIWNKIKNEELIISNSIVLEVMTVLNIKLKVSEEILEKSFINLNSGKFKIIEDISLYDGALKRQMTYLPQRMPFVACLYIELMDQLKIKEIVSFEKHFDNKENISRIH
jgi:predicted nucleic acid-binding protein